MIRKNMSKVLASTIACVVLVGITGVPASASEDESFRLWVEPISLWVLEKDQNTNSSKFQEYMDFSSGMWAGLKIGGESADGDRTLAVNMSAIGRDHARYTLDYGVAGEYAFSVDYNKIRHLFGNDATLLWDQPAVNRFEIPDPVQQLVLDAILAQRAGGGSVNFDFLTPLLAPYYATANTVDLGLQRNRTRARFDLGKMGRFAWAFEYNHENRDGSRPMGASFGFNNVQEIPEPVTYQTTSAEISGELNGKKGGVRFGYRHSTFENDVDFVEWDNIFRSFDSTNGIAYLGPNSTPEGPSRGRTDLAPDNDSDLLFVDGRGKAGGWWYNGSLSYNMMSQDDALLPFTINTAIVGTNDRTGASFDASTTAGLPASSADREVEVMTLSGNAGTDLGDDWSLTFRFRSYDYDNTSRQLEFPGYARLDAVWEPFALLTIPYDYTKDNYGVELAWDASDTTQLTLGYMLESWDRTFREIESSDEDTIKLAINSRPTDKVALRASWATGDRTTSHYDVEAQEVFFVHPEGINNQPGLRKYDEAERDVNDYDAQVQFFPNESWNLSVGFSGRDDDYGKSEFGLASEETTSYNFELGYTPGADLNFYVFGHVADHDVFQRARQSGGTLSTNPLDDWNLALNEDTTTWGIGLTSKRDNGWTWDISAHISDSDGEADFQTPVGGRDAVDFDNYEDIELTSLWARASYEINPLASVGFFYLFEDYSINSFILQGVVPYLPQSILMAPNDGDYEANLFGVNLRFMF